jgi:putative hydrolase of the HAD superfamily
LEELQGAYQLAIVTDAQWVFSEPEIRILGLDRYFHPIVLSSRYFVCKPAPQIYAHALKGLLLSPAEALYVGNDPEGDLPGPQTLGMPAVLIDRAGSRAPQPAPVIRDLRELPDLIRSGRFAGSG